MEQRIDFVSLLTPVESEEDNNDDTGSHGQLLKSEEGSRETLNVCDYSDNMSLFVHVELHV